MGKGLLNLAPGVGWAAHLAHLVLGGGFVLVFLKNEPIYLDI